MLGNFSREFNAIAVVMKLLFGVLVSIALLAMTEAQRPTRRPGRPTGRPGGGGMGNAGSTVSGPSNNFKAFKGNG